jgi:hypothetical protein
VEGADVARLTEFLRDFKSVPEQDDIYGDGEMDIDNIQPKYMKIMAFPYNAAAHFVARSREPSTGFYLS